MQVEQLKALIHATTTTTTTAKETKGQKEEAERGSQLLNPPSQVDPTEEMAKKKILADYKFSESILDAIGAPPTRVELADIITMKPGDRNEIAKCFPDCRKLERLETPKDIKPEEKRNMSPADLHWVTKVTPELVKRWKEISSGLLMLAQGTITEELSWDYKDSDTSSRLELQTHDVHTGLMNVLRLQMDLLAYMVQTCRKTVLRANGHEEPSPDEEERLIISSEKRKEIREKTETELAIAMSGSPILKTAGFLSGRGRGGSRYGGRKRAFFAPLGAPPTRRPRFFKKDSQSEPQGGFQTGAGFGKKPFGPRTFRGGQVFRARGRGSRGRGRSYGGPLSQKW
jgi:hypothetical protein